jgi:hypothetical protein
MPHKIPLPRCWKRRVRSSVLHICWNNGPLHGTRGPLHPAREAARNKLDDAFDASPVIVGEEKYLRGHKHLYSVAAL